MFRGVVILDVAREGVCCADGVLTCDDGDGGCVVWSSVDTLGDDGGDELEDVGSDGAGHDVGSADLLDDVGLVCFRVDGSVVCDDGLAVALRSDLDDLVRLGVLQALDELVHHIAEDDFISGVVEAADAGKLEQG